MTDRDCMWQWKRNPSSELKTERRKVEREVSHQQKVHYNSGISI